ncbi:MAG: hypothetical protein M9905_08270 [Rhizobiaceae bacterium]|nr:hypothetical protein [Rhizobiaceae bacterium]
MILITPFSARLIGAAGDGRDAEIHVLRGDRDCHRLRRLERDELDLEILFGRNSPLAAMMLGECDVRDRSPTLMASAA